MLLLISNILFSVQLSLSEDGISGLNLGLKPKIVKNGD